MRILNPIVAILAVLMLVLSSGIGEFCSALCLEAKAQTELESQDCICPSVYASNTLAKNQASAQFNALHAGVDSCDLCIELPTGIEDEQLLLAKSPKVKALSTSVVQTIHTIFVSASPSPLSSAFANTTACLNRGSLPLRI